MVKSHDVHLDGEYADWIAELKHRYRAAQVKASVRVNSEKLLFNWELGRDLVQKKAEEKWGAGVVEQVSLDLQREFPGNEGFSARNLWRMKQWYLFYNQSDTKLPQLGAEFKNVKLPQAGTEILLQPVREIEDEKLQQSVEEIPEFAGKLNFYVNAVDDLLKDKEDNPTIGLLICSDMNKAEVQWSFRGISTPIGVATYNNIRIKMRCLRRNNSKSVWNCYSVRCERRND